MKYQIEKKQTNKVSLVELLIPTLNEVVGINSYLLCWKGKIMNNHNKINSYRQNISVVAT